MKLNNTEISAVKFNGVDINVVRINDVEVFSAEQNYFCIENISGEVNDIKLTPTGEMTNLPVLEYSFDKRQWHNLILNQNVSIQANGKLYMRGNNETISETFQKQIRIQTTNNINVSGNIMTLLDKRGKLTTISHIACFDGLFANNSNLINAKDLILPATNLSEDCYRSMFSDCRYLISVPELPAMALAKGCYLYMFSNCRSLVKAPKLLATTLAIGCYNSMFKGCELLTTINNLPVNNIPQSAYYSMYSGCSKIKLSTTQTGEYQTSYRIPSSGEGVIGVQSLTSMFYDTGGTFTGTPAINTIYYTSNEVI